MFQPRPRLTSTIQHPQRSPPYYRHVSDISHTIAFFQFTSHLLCAPQRVREKDEEGPSHASLMAQFQTSTSPTDALAVLRTQVQQFELSTSGDDKLTKWLSPTVNVLYAFSSAIGAGVGLVSFTGRYFYGLTSDIISRYSRRRTSSLLVLVSYFR